MIFTVLHSVLARSGKVDQILSNPYGELVWWFPMSSEQYRFQGRFQLVYPQESDQPEPLGLSQERLEAWKKLSPPAKAQFHWPQPGVSHTGLQENDLEDVCDEDDSGPPPLNFLLLVLIPTKVHYLRLKDNYAALETMSDGLWAWQRVNP